MIELRWKIKITIFLSRFFSLLLGIAICLLFCADRGDPIELLDRATWVPYYLLTAKIIRPVAVDLSKARVEVCVAVRSLSPHR